MVNAAIYVRLSQDDKDNPSESIKNQKMICNNYAIQNDLTIVKTYEEIISGSSEDRKQFNLMLSDAKKDIFKVILCKDWDRWGRDYAIANKAIKELNEIGIEIIPVFDIKDGLGRSFKLFFGEMYVQMCRDKTKVIHDIKLKEGINLTKPPFGYKKKMEINNKEAEIVKKVFELFNNGIKVKDIQTQINFKKLQLRKVYLILKNRIYIGEIQYRGKWMPGKHKPIITKEQFDLAQSKFKKREKII